MKDFTRFLNETFGAPIEAGDAAVVNATVDPMAAETDPNDDRFYPTNKNELGVAIDKVVKELPDDFVRPFYKEIKKTISNFEKGGGQSMSNADGKKKNNMEESIRKIVRGMLSEMKILNEAPEDDEDDGTPYIPEPEVDGSDTAGVERAKFLAKRRGKIKQAAQAQGNPKHAQARAAMNAAARERLAAETEADPAADAGRATANYDASGLRSFSDIAAKLGMSSDSGAKAVIYKIEDKMKFANEFWDDHDLQEIIATAVHDYITELEELGTVDGEPPEDEITPEDVALLRANPDMVSDLESFRVYLQNELEERGYADAFSKLGKQQRANDSLWYSDQGLPVPKGIGDPNVPDDRSLNPSEDERKKEAEQRAKRAAARAKVAARMAKKK